MFATADDELRPVMNGIYFDITTEDITMVASDGHKLVRCKTLEMCIRDRFEMIYDIDPLKQRIADSWPDSLADTCAREEWGWKPAYKLESMTVDMLEKLREKLK